MNTGVWISPRGYAACPHARYRQVCFVFCPAGSRNLSRVRSQMPLFRCNSLCKKKGDRVAQCRYANNQTSFYYTVKRSPVSPGLYLGKGKVNLFSNPWVFFKVEPRLKTQLRALTT